MKLVEANTPEYITGAVSAICFRAAIRHVPRASGMFATPVDVHLALQWTGRHGAQSASSVGEQLATTYGTYLPLLQSHPEAKTGPHRLPETHANSGHPHVGRRSQIPTPQAMRPKYRGCPCLGSEIPQVLPCAKCRGPGKTRSFSPRGVCAGRRFWFGIGFWRRLIP